MSAASFLRSSGDISGKASARLLERALLPVEMRRDQPPRQPDWRDAVSSGSARAAAWRTRNPKYSRRKRRSLEKVIRSARPLGSRAEGA